MNVSLENKVVVVTGSSSGIGAELAVAFARNGANVVVHYNTRAEQAEKVYEKALRYGTDCILIKANLAVEAQVKSLYEEVIRHYGRVDVLINNAGMCKDALCSIMSANTWKTVVETNLYSVFYCCKYFSKYMIRHNYGKIINVASYKGVVGCDGQANYSASKAGVIGLTKTLARELSAFNISVNAVCPGFILTMLNKKTPMKIAKAKQQSLMPINNNMSTLVNTMLFMSSDRFEGVTGQVIHVDSRIV